MTKKNILVVAAHSDDIEIGMAMKIYDYVQRGYSVYELILSRGELGGDPGIRTEEAKKAAKIMGVCETWFCEHPNTRFDEVRNDVKNSIEKKVNEIKPSVVFGHWPYDEHIDHIIAGKELLVAARSVPNLIYYDSLRSQNFVPNYAFYQGQKFMDIKLSATKCHSSQIERNGISLDFILAAGEYWAHKFNHQRCIEGIKNDLKLSSTDKVYAEVFHIHRSSKI